MKKKSTTKSAFFNLRALIALVLCLAGVVVALGAEFSLTHSKGQAAKPAQAAQGSAIPSTASRSGITKFGPNGPDLVQLVGPVAQNKDLRKLPYIPQEEESEHEPLMRYPHPKTGALPPAEISSPLLQSLVKGLFRPVPKMPGPLLTFDGMSFSQGGAGWPPDTNGDVGPNHYVETVNTSIRIFDKSGNSLAGPITFNSFFSGLVGTPCQNQNFGDPFVLYDHMADRWVISDFAFPSFPGNSFWQCIGVSQTGDPVSGGYFLYAIQIDPAHPAQLGDYPKFALWPDAYYFTVNLFTNNTTFNGVRVFALDRASMISGGPTNAIAFTIPPTPDGLGDSYSLVPASVRTGDPPPAGRDEFLLAVDSPLTGGVPLNVVKGWLFHVDFQSPENSNLGVGANHGPHAEISATPFIDAFTDTAGFSIVPQQGVSQRIDTLGDKIMTPVVYQNRNATESLWATQTVILNYPNGPTAVRWYQFDVTGGIFRFTVQEQSWDNGGDGLWRFMPSIAVDEDGNTAIGYSASGSTEFPSIRYAGRLAADPLNNLGQGEAIMTSGDGSQTGTCGNVPCARWGDYTMTTIDPSDGMSFWHANEYYTATGLQWHTRVGKFNFVGGGGTPTPTPTATPTPTPGGSCPPTITQSISQAIALGNSVACANNTTGETTENHYWRAFNMSTFTGGQQYNITSVDFGIELAESGSGSGQPLTVNLYANHGAPFPNGDWQSNLIVTSGSINIPDQSLTIFSVPITATVAAGTLELVLEVTTPNGVGLGNRFFVGSNPDPQTGLSYLSASDCGLADPTPTGDIGSPDMHIVFNVNGSCPGGTPTPTPTPTATTTPTATPTPTSTVTPRPHPTPRPRPTPPPRPTLPR